MITEQQTIIMNVISAAEGKILIRKDELETYNENPFNVSFSTKIYLNSEDSADNYIEVDLPEEPVEE